MSTDIQTGHGGHDHGAEPGEVGFHVSLRGYLTGFGLSVLLTAIPFYLVMTGVIQDKLATGLLVMGLAGVQIIVHMIYFLHMSPKAENGWSMMALIFTIILVVIALSGSLWVMYHLNANMMPMSVDEMRQMP
jgi:cytochrome o ubiquinol oxidase operon protein cyoD